MTNPSVALSDDTACQYEACYRYQRILVGLKTALTEITVEYLMPMTARRTVIRLLLSALPDDAREEAANRLADLGTRIARLDAGHPEQLQLSTELDALAAEAAAAVLPAIVAAVIEHEQQTSGGAS